MGKLLSAACAVEQFSASIQVNVFLVLDDLVDVVREGLDGDGLAVLGFAVDGLGS